MLILRFLACNHTRDALKFKSIFENVHKIDILVVLMAFPEILMYACHLLNFLLKIQEFSLVMPQSLHIMLA